MEPIYIRSSVQVRRNIDQPPYLLPFTFYGVPLSSVVYEYLTVYGVLVPTHLSPLPLLSHLSASLSPLPTAQPLLRPLSTTTSRVSQMS